MKNKYARLSKSEKKEALKAYREAAPQFERVAKSAKRMYFACALAMVLCIAGFVFESIFGNLKTPDYISYGLIFIFSIASVVFVRKTHIRQVNMFLCHMDAGKKEITKEVNQEKEEKKTTKKDSTKTKTSTKKTSVKKTTTKKTK